MKFMSYLWHAFKQPANLIYLVAGAIGTVTLLAAVPYAMPAWLGLEALYLGYMSSNKRFQRHVKSKLAREDEAYLQQRHKNLIRGSKTEFRNRLRKFERNILDIKRNYRQNSRSDSASYMLDNSLNSIDELESKYVRFLFNYVRLHSLEKDPQKDHILKQEITKLENEIARASERMKPVLEQRHSILTKRLANRNISKENVQMLEAQLETIEETLEYLKEQSLNLSNLESVSTQVDEALTRMDTARDTLLEIETFMSSTDELSAAVDDYTRAKQRY